MWKNRLLALGILLIGIGLLRVPSGVMGQDSFGPITTIETHNGVVRGMTFSHDNQRLLTWEVSGGCEACKRSSGEVFVRNTRTGEVELQLPELAVAGAYWNDDESLILSYGTSRQYSTLTIWDSAGKALVRVTGVQNYEWTADGKWLVVAWRASEDAPVQTDLWDVLAGEVVTSWQSAFRMALIDDILVYREERDVLLFYSVSQQRLLNRLDWEGFNVSVGRSPDGQILLFDREYSYTYDVTTGALAVFADQKNQWGLSWSASNQDMTLLAGVELETREFHIYDVATGQLLREMSLMEAYEFGWMPNSNLLYTLGADGVVYFWDGYTGELLHNLTHGLGVAGVWPANRYLLLITNTRQGEIGLWNLETGVWLNVDAAAIGDSAWVTDVAWSKDDHYFALTWYRTITIWHTEALFAAQQEFPVVNWQVEGRRLFTQWRCNSCHMSEQASGPSLMGIYGQERVRPDGTKFFVDEAYLTATLLTDDGYTVPDYEPVHPLSHPVFFPREIEALTAYLMSLE